MNRCGARRHLTYALCRGLVWGAGLLAGPVWALHTCSVVVNGTGAIYVRNSASDANGTVVLTCSRSSSDPDTLSYRIKATNGLHYDNQARNVQLAGTANQLSYSLSRGRSAGGSADCRNNSNWQAPATGTSDVIRGTLAFGTALTATATWGYCVRVRGNQGAPPGGLYTDTMEIFAQYPDSDMGVLTPSAMANYTVGVNNECVFSAFPGTLAFTYTAFSTAAQAASTGFSLRCSAGLPWSVSVSPSSTTLLGLKYDILPSPASGTGNGDTDQSVTLQGSMQPGQAGSCAAAACSATQLHTVTISY